MSKVAMTILMSWRLLPQNSVAPTAGFTHKLGILRRGHLYGQVPKLSLPWLAFYFSDILQGSLMPDGLVEYNVEGWTMKANSCIVSGMLSKAWYIGHVWCTWLERSGDEPVQLVVSWLVITLTYSASPLMIAMKPIIKRKRHSKQEFESETRVFSISKTVTTTSTVVLSPPKDLY